eukprot:4430136-Amphidinium_carterae.1
MDMSCMSHWMTPCSRTQNPLTTEEDILRVQKGPGPSQKRKRPRALTTNRASKTAGTWYRSGTAPNLSL